MCGWTGCYRGTDRAVQQGDEAGPTEGGADWICRDVSLFKRHQTKISPLAVRKRIQAGIVGGFLTSTLGAGLFAACWLMPRAGSGSTRVGLLQRA